ncbi:MAG: flippase-like domain-containing protein [Thermoleophilaceae bacterium]|nr:flippase-like domain-containing protein [Thermoleophilaceae bacterium]
MEEPHQADIQDASGMTEEERKLERSQVVRGILGPLIAIAVLIALLWPHFDEIGEAWKLISVRAAAALVLLHLIALLLRAEAWGLCIDAAGAPIERSLLHSSSSLRFLADTVVPTYIGAWVRIGLVRRYDAPRAARPGASPSPTIGQMFTADGLMLLVEAVITIGLIVAAVLTSSLEWWWIFVFAAAVGVLLLIVRWVFIRYKEREFARTARVLQNSSQRYKLAALLTVVLTLQPIRYYIAFKALGLDPSMSDALLAFLLTTVFNALPIGPGPSSIAASAALFANEGLDKTASAGLVLLASAIVAAAVYSIYGAFELVRRSRAINAEKLSQLEGASAGSTEG